MKRTALLCVALAFTACDSEPEDPADARAALLEADEADEAEEDGGRRHDGDGFHHRGERGRHDRGASICEHVGCSDEQRERVQAAFARPERGDRPERPDMSAANERLAQAFASEGFTKADIDAWRSQRPERPDHRAHHIDAMSELHAILDAEQRALLATKIVKGEVFAGKHRDGKRERHSKDGERHAEHLVRRVDHFCKPLECTDSQGEQLEQIFERKHEAHQRGEKDERAAALAKAFEAETFDADALTDLRGGPDEGEKDSLLVEVHGVLTAEQRATLSERIAEHGPRALMGKHGRRGKHGKRGRRRGGPHKERPARGLG